MSNKRISGFRLDDWAVVSIRFCRVSPVPSSVAQTSHKDLVEGEGGDTRVSDGVCVCGGG